MEIQKSVSFQCLVLRGGGGGGVGVWKGERKRAVLLTVHVSGNIEIQLCCQSLNWFTKATVNHIWRRINADGHGL